MRLKQLVCSLVLIYFGNPQLDIQQKQTIENFRPWSRGMLNFDILVKGLGIVSPQQFCLRLLEKNVSRSVLVCPAPGPLLGSWLWPPSSGPQFVFTGPGHQFVFTSSGPQFVFTGPGHQFVFTSPGPQFVLTGPGPQFVFTTPGPCVYRPWRKLCICRSWSLNWIYQLWPRLWSPICIYQCRSIFY